MFRSNGFVEQAATGGAGVPGLTAGPQRFGSAPSFLGLRFDSTIRTAGGTLINPFLSVAYVHEFVPYRQLTATLNARLAAVVAQRVAIFAAFNGDFAPVARSYAGNGGVRVSF